MIRVILCVLLLVWSSSVVAVPAQEPVGSIVGWYDSLPGTPALPEGWERCDGQVLVDGDSPYHGLTLPDLNLARRFLRGGAVSGVLQADAFQGHHHAVTHNALRLWNSGPTVTGPHWLDFPAAVIAARTAISDGVHGSPRTATETRPVNTGVSWVLETKPSLAPVGAVVGWHRDLDGTPSLPDGWVECAGQVLDDVESVYHGLTLPDLNGGARFLRGASLSGAFESDAFQGHHHAVIHNATNVFHWPIWYDILNADTGILPATITCGDLLSDGIHGTPRVGVESRPVNMSVVWILKVKQASLPLGALVAWHQDLPGTPPLPPSARPCDGSSVDDALSPYVGQDMPELNASGRFLRGGGISGADQADTVQGHRHSVSDDAYTWTAGTTVRTAPPGGAGMTLASIQIRDPITDGSNGTPRTADETRPINMSVVWLLHYKDPWVDLGHALAGLHGDPLLTASGSLVGGDELVLQLTNARENSTAFLVVSLTELNAPVKGGVLVPALGLAGFPLVRPTGPLGEVPISLTWPSGVPSGIALYCQYWIQDPAGPVNYSASNALSGTTP